MPLKAVDAMAMGRPIVASAVSDLPEVLDGCGRLVPPATSTRWRRRSTSCSTTRRRRGARRSARARCLERYSFERVGEQLAEIVSGRPA